MSEAHSLSIAGITPIYEVGSDAWTAWKKLGKPLEIEIASGANSDEPRVIARMRLLPGGVNQPARTEWLKRMGRRMEARSRERRRGYHYPSIATVTGLKVSEELAGCSAADVLDFVADLLPDLWLDRYQQEKLLFIECRPARLGVGDRELDESWKLFSKEGAALQAPHATSTSVTQDHLAIRPMVDDLEAELHPWTRKSAAQGGPQMTESVAKQFTPAMLGGLVEGLSWVKDPRMKRTYDYPAAAVVAMVCLARYAGAKSMEKHARFARLLSQEQRAALGLAKVEKCGESSGKLRVPSQDMFNDFITASRKSRYDSCTEDEFRKRFGCDRPLDEEGRQMISGPLVIRCFNEWLKSHRLMPFPCDQELWLKQKQRRRTKERGGLTK